MTHIGDLPDEMLEMVLLRVVDGTSEILRVE